MAVLFSMADIITRVFPSGRGRQRGRIRELRVSKGIECVTSFEDGDTGTGVKQCGRKGKGIHPLLRLQKEPSLLAVGC